MRESGNWEKEMEKESISGLMVRFIKESSKIMSVMALVYFIIMMERNLREYGEMVKSMVKQFISGLMELDIMFST